MVKSIFTVRHGEGQHQINPDIWKTASNREVALTPLGEQQAQEGGQFLKDFPLDPQKTVIITSPLGRASQTAEIIRQSLPGANLMIEPLLEDQDFGTFTGLTTEQCYEKHPILARLYDLHARRYGKYHVRPPRGETKEELVQRIEKFVKKASAWFENSEYDNMVIVSHSLINQAVSKILNDQPPEWFLNLQPLPNCSVKKYIWANSVWIDKGIVFAPERQGTNLVLACPDHLKGKIRNEGHSR